VTSPLKTDLIIEGPPTASDQIVQTVKIDLPDFLELDIEGSEREALRGASIPLSLFRLRVKVSIERRPEDAMVGPRVRLSDPGRRTFIDAGVRSTIQEHIGSGEETKFG
jgi:methyltransferase FkbM-like protein